MSALTRLEQLERLGAVCTNRLAAYTAFGNQQSVERDAAWASLSRSLRDYSNALDTLAPSLIAATHSLIHLVGNPCRACGAPGACAPGCANAAARAALASFDALPRFATEARS